MDILVYNDQTRLELEPTFVAGLDEALSHSRALYSYCAARGGKFRSLPAIELPSVNVSVLVDACAAPAGAVSTRLAPRLAALSSAHPKFAFGEAAAAFVRQQGRKSKYLDESAI